MEKEYHPMHISPIGTALILTGALWLSVGSPARAQGTRNTKHSAATVAAGGATKADAIASAVFDHLTEVLDLHWHKGEYNHIVNLSRMIVGARPHDMNVYANA